MPALTTGFIEAGQGEATSTAESIALQSVQNRVYMTKDCKSARLSVQEGSEL